MSPATIRLVCSALLAAPLSGCFMMTNHVEPPADWPALKVIERPLSVIDVQRKCSRHLTVGSAIFSLGLTMGCAEVDFAAGVCTIYIARGENDPGILEHERDHCAGKDHLGGDMTLRTAWERYKQSQASQLAQAAPLGAAGEAQGVKRVRKSALDRQRLALQLARQDLRGERSPDKPARAVGKGAVDAVGDPAHQR